ALKDIPLTWTSAGRRLRPLRSEYHRGCERDSSTLANARQSPSLSCAGRASAPIEWVALRKCVMRRRQRWMGVALCAAIAWAPAAAVPAGAAEVSLSNLALKNPYLKLAPEADSVALSGWKQLFSPTSITCPGPGGICTARITLSVVLSTFNKG